MEAIIGLLELVGGVILFFAAGLLFARISGYGEYYDKMLYDEESDAYITIKKNKIDTDEYATIKKNKKNDEDHEDDIIHHLAI